MVVAKQWDESLLGRAMAQLTDMQVDEVFEYQDKMRYPPLFGELNAAQRFDTYLFIRRNLLPQEQREEFIRQEAIRIAERPKDLRLIQKATQLVHGRLECLCGKLVRQCSCPGLKEIIYTRRYCCPTNITFEEVQLQ